ncbi:uncharacterized protein LOC123005274 [Tribolium madens]|uniref:uncharacterized protein LOC123005274 n=1 Tax=Tribolium madens TaxID=41895 RepID=UPI001CF745A3|nr:uncharacterized protein LOC123005274 [Tribolium madens]
MRVQPDEVEFIGWLDQLGNGTLPTVEFNNENRQQQETRLRRDTIQIPQRCIVNGLDELINRIFGQDFRPDAFVNTAILTPLNADCHRIIASILNRIQAPVRTYRSVDRVVTDIPAEAANYPEEFLNSLTPSEFAQHELTLKEGTIVMLLRNLNVRANLCNGTRLVIRHLREHFIKAEIINFDGQLSGRREFLPRIEFESSENEPLPFVLKRRQLRLSYCMTINKSQGQTFDSVGIFLPRPVFTHVPQQFKSAGEDGGFTVTTRRRRTAATPIKVAATPLNVATAPAPANSTVVAGAEVGVGVGAAAAAGIKAARVKPWQLQSLTTFYQEVQQKAQQENTTLVSVLADIDIAINEVKEDTKNMKKDMNNLKTLNTGYYSG